MSTVPDANLRASRGEPAAWRRFCRAFAMTLAIALGGIAALNVAVNPLGLYPTPPHTVLTSNSRAEKVELLRHAPPPEVLILGSSRVMKLAPAEVTRLTGLRAFNAAVDSAMAEDDYAMLRFAAEDARAPLQLVILGLDVEAFHNTQPADFRLWSVAPLVSKLYASPFRPAWEKMTKAISGPQTKLSLRTLAARNAAPVLTRRFEGDGTMHYPLWEREKAKGAYTLAPRVASSVVEYRRRFQGYAAISLDRAAYFRRTLAYAHARNLKVVVFLTPIHPEVVAALGLPYQRIRQRLLAELPGWCREAGAGFVDLSELQSFGGDPAAFFDGGHVDDQNAARLLRRVLAD